MMYPLVRNLAADGIPVAVTARYSDSPLKRSTNGLKIL